MVEKTSFERLESILRKRKKTEFAYEVVIALVIGNFAFLNLFAARQFAELAIKAYGQAAVVSSFGIQLNVGILAMVLFSFLSFIVLVKFTGDRIGQEREITKLLYAVERRRK